MSAFIAPIISGLAGLFGGGQQQKVKTDSTQTQSADQTQNSSSNTSGRITPDLSPLQQRLAELFGQGAADQYNNSVNLNPYTTGGLQQIQQQGGANNRIASNIAAQRGLSFSPAGANALTQNTLNTGNQANSFLQSIPLIQRQLQQQSLQSLMSAFGALPTGTTSEGNSSAFASGHSDGTSHTEGTNVQNGNPWAGALGGFGEGLAAPSSKSSNLGSILKMFGLTGK